MKDKDPVGEFLKKRGCPEHVIRGGLRGLVEGWEEVVRAVEEGYGLGLDDYLNDMDGRQLLEEALAAAPAQEKKGILGRLRKADAKMRTLVRPAGRCLWGDETARQEGWTAAKNWWYYCRPIKAGEDLMAELDEG
ncbi:MAG TPA: hypothetical protein PKN59_08585 [Syntrophales bacterium]|nr:hypothetical protein [Syntrophales bacterium]